MDSKKPKVQVLLSSYNGEKYITEQLDSLLAQKGDFELKITVRDDGSTDSTHDILARYSENFGIDVIYGENIGVNASMMDLVKRSEEDFDYFAFSDQDDVWEDFKISEAVKSLSLCTESEFLLWTCMEELTDADLNVYSLMPYPKYLGDFYSAIIQNKAGGHTQVFNKKLRDMYKFYPPEKMYVFDWVLYILASEFGKILYCDRSCGKYRQHSANSIGYELNPIAQIPRRLKRLFNGAFKGITTQMVYFYEIYEDKLQKEHREELKRFFGSRKNIFKRICYAFTTKIKRNSVFESLQFRILYVLGVFKSTNDESHKSF